MSASWGVADRGLPCACPGAYYEDCMLRQVHSVCKYCVLLVAVLIPSTIKPIRLCLRLLPNRHLLTALSACRPHSMQQYSKQQLPRPPKLPRLQPCHLHRPWLGRPCHRHSWRNRCTLLRGSSVRTC